MWWIVQKVFKVSAEQNVERSPYEKEFDDMGYVVVPEALSADHVARLNDVLDELTRHDSTRIHNVADILRLSNEFVDMIDLPTVLPKIQKLLGNNIWVNHTHYNVNPPQTEYNESGSTFDFGWHRDGGVINEDVPPPAPLLSLKVGFYLTDLSDLGRGQTYVIGGSHKTGEKKPSREMLPDTATPLCVGPGTAVIYDRRLIHSIRSENNSDITRRAIFIQYAFRWLAAVDAMTVQHLRGTCSPTRLQLLGLSSSYNEFDGAAGRSGLYYPRAEDTPLAGNIPSKMTKIIDSVRRRIKRYLFS